MNLLKSIKYRYETFVLNTKWDFLIWEKTKARYHRSSGKKQKLVIIEKQGKSLTIIIPKISMRSFIG